MMKILHFSNKPAFPLIDGGCIAIKSILKSLIKHADVEVYHFTLATQKHPFSLSAYPDSWRDKIIIEDCVIDTKTDLIGAAINLIKNKSYNIERFNQKKVRKRLTDLLTDYNFDLVVVESIFLLPYTSLFKEKGIKVFARTHNIEHKIWEQLASDSSNPIKKWYLRLLSKQLKRAEIKSLNQVDGIISISSDDTAYFQRNLDDCPKITTIETAVNYPKKPSEVEKNDFYFLGAMDWKPNIEGVNWLLKEVFKSEQFPNEFHLAGKSLKKNEIKHSGLICHGEIEDALAFINAHGICIIPLLSGSGIKIKLLENMAMGKPIVTTSEGVRGIDVVHGTHVLIADTPLDFKNAMIKLMNDEILRKDLGFAAYQFVINNFDENILTNRLVEFIAEK